jgi:NADH-ubiquinone oxidoreductase chain 4L
MSSSLLFMLQIIPIIMLIAFMLQQSHLLITLLTLEGLILRLVLVIPIVLRINSQPLGVIRVLILTLGACEARLGLALLVILARSFGSDIVRNLSINKC